MPTVDEYRELVKECRWQWITYNGVNGQKVTGPNGNSIFLPTSATGSRTYWSGSSVAGSIDHAWVLNFDRGLAYWGYRCYRYRGLAVRPVSD